MKKFIKEQPVPGYTNKNNIDSQFYKRLPSTGPWKSTIL